MLGSTEHAEPITWAAAAASLDSFDGLFWAGGHGEGMGVLLNGTASLQLARDFWLLRRPVAAICHGVLVLSRAGLLHGVATTGLPAWLEAQAHLLTSYVAGLGAYQLATTNGQFTEHEILAQLGSDAESYVHSPLDILAPLVPGTATNHRHAFIAEDPGQAYVSARFWGDAYLLAQRFATLLDAGTRAQARAPPASTSAPLS